MKMDVPKVIKRFGGRTKMHKRLKKCGIDMSIRTLDNWVYHGIISMPRWIQLMGVAKAAGWALKLEDFLVE
jgi:hypothetical protein